VRRARSRELGAGILVGALLLATASAADPPEALPPELGPGPGSSPADSRVTGLGPPPDAEIGAPRRRSEPAPSPLARRRRSRAPAPLGLGPRLARRLRDGAVDTLQPYLAIDAPPDAPGVLARIGAVTAGRASAGTLRHLGLRARFVDAPQALRPSLDRALESVGVDRLHAGLGALAPVRGRGVLVGLYDSGIDPSHAAFRDADGRLRVTAFLSQRPDGTEAETCDAARIAAGRCPLADPLGHGTHVASLALGDDARGPGVAPEAELVLATEAELGQLVPALAWIRDVAAALGRPLVFNLSAGGHGGAHDGSSPEARALSALPHLAVVAAGNDAGHSLHARIDAVPGASRLVGLTPPPGRSAPYLEIWGSPGGAVVAELGLVRPGEGWLVGTSSIGVGDDGRTETLDWAGAPLLEVALDAEPTPHPGNDRPHLRLELSVPDAAALSTRGLRLALRLSGRGEIHVWADVESGVPPSLDARPTLGDPSQALADDAHSISDVATATAALAVASWDLRTEVPGPSGSVRVGGREGGISAFTSRGPSLAPERTGPRPSLAAPGAWLIGARAADTALGVVVDETHVALSGTSMATPLVAGAAALLLELRPDASSAELAAALLGSTEPPPDDDPRWGAGRLDARAAVTAWTGEDDADCGCYTAARPRRGATLLAWLALGAALWARTARATGSTCTRGSAARRTGARRR
jgi:subtilisin family serine protease